MVLGTRLNLIPLYHGGKGKGPGFGSSGELGGGMPWWITPCVYATLTHTSATWWLEIRPMWRCWLACVLTIWWHIPSPVLCEGSLEGGVNPHALGTLTSVLLSRMQTSVLSSF